MKKYVKKQYKLIKFILMIIISAGFLWGCQVKPNSQTIYTADAYALDTYVRVSLYGCGSQELAKKAVGLCDYYEKIFSRTDENSLLTMLNEAGSLSQDDAEQWQNDTDISEDGIGDAYDSLYELIDSGLAYSGLTDGALDVTIEPLSSLWNFSSGENILPDEHDIEEAQKAVDYTKVDINGSEIALNGTRIDLGAIAKGYIADAICRYLVSEGVDSAIVDLGGNIACVGHKPDGSGFTVGVKKPFDDNGGIIQTLNISDMSVVTSGVYERYFYVGDSFYHHIIDSQTGYPCDNGLLSVTIISESSLQCDCLSTGCFVMGMDKAMELVDSMDDVYAIFIDTDYQVFYSEGAEKYVAE